MKRLLSLLLVLLLATAAFAKIPLPQNNTYVNDFAHVLTKKQIKALNKRIRAFENKTSVQMAVVLVNYLPNGYTIEDYATLIGRKWHVGRANDGLVYVAAIKQRKQRLEVAENLQKYITDERAANVLDWVKISLKYDLYYDAMKTLVSQTSVELAEGKEIWTGSEKIRIDEKHNADSLVRADALSAKDTDKFSSNVFYYIVGGFFLMFFWKPLMGLIGFVLGLIVSIFSKHKPKPVDEDEEYENEVGDSALPSYTGTRRYQRPSYRSSGNRYSTPLVHHHHTDTLADERRRHEQRLLNEEREREEERRMAERRREEQEERRREEEEERRQKEEDRRREEDERSYGNWGKNNDGSRGSSSSTSGFNGGGASSDW